MYKNKGFIVFLTKNWKPLVDNVIESVMRFSKYDIEVNCINFIHEYNNPRIRTKELQISNEDFFNITTCKLMASINTEFDLALMLDGDMIVTNHIDNIFTDNEERISNCKFPLFAKHPHNPNYNHIIAKITEKKQKLNWVYSHYLFTKEHKWFFEEALKGMQAVPEDQHVDYYPVPEEGFLNALLAHYEVDYDLGYNYLPNGFVSIINDFLYGNDDGKQSINDDYLKYDCRVKFYAFHGHNIKNPIYGKQVIELIDTLRPELIDRS